MFLGQWFRPRATRASSPVPPCAGRYRVEALETRLHLDAADFDPSFGTGGIAQLFISAGLIKTTAVTVDPRDGSSVVVGYTDVALLGDDPDFVVIRFLPNGQADPNFGFGFGFVVQDMIAGFQDFATSLAIQPDGKIVVAGYTDGFNPFGFPDRDIVLARFNPDGTLDSSFGNTQDRPGIAQVDLTQPFATQRSLEQANSVIVQGNGNIIVGGGTTSISEDLERADVALVRFTPSGQFDNTFGFGGLGFVVTELPNDEIFNALAVQADGKIVAVGTIGLFDEDGFPQTTRVLITRYNADGSVDTAFNPDNPEFGGIFFFTFDAILVEGDYDDGYAVEIGPDGRIYVGGVNGTRDPFTGELIANFGIERLNPDGSFDETWGGTSGGVITDLGVLAGATDIAVQDDGKVVVGGKIAASEADVDAGNFGVAVVRYNFDGSIDQAFDNDGQILLDTDFSIFGPFNLPEPRQPVSAQANGDDGLVQEFETFQANTQGLIDVTPRGRILIVAFRDQTVRVAQVLGSGPPVANAALKGDRFTASPLPAIEFDVEYIDDVAVALATLGENDLLIVGPGGVERLAQFVGNNGAIGDAERLSGRYRFLPADGTVFKASENGAYNILVLDNAVSDASGGFATRATVGNFELAIEGQVVPPPPARVPGIAVASVAGKVPPSVIGGDRKARAALAVALTNAADAAFAGPVTVTLFASTDGTLDPGKATQIAQVNANLRLKPAASKPVKVNALIPALANGSYTLVARVSGAGTDNVEFARGGPAVAVEQPVIRIIVPAAAPLPRPLKLGKTGMVALPLRNGGNVMAKGTAAIELLASTDGTPANATSLGVVNAKVGLKPGASKPARLKLALPASLPAGPGTYTLLARLTSVGSLGAPNETDGTIVGSIQVTFV